MQFLQISEPEEKIKIDQSGYAIGIDLGTTNSVVACTINGKPEVLGPIYPSVYNDIRSIKRLMGSNEVVENLTPVEISSKILLALKEQAESFLKEAVTKAVITVPAHFDDAARSATKLAANMAGLEVLRLINEPTAAAVAYGLDNDAEGLYLIYDFGGGTFDVSILKMQKGVFQVLATGGDTKLGGDDIDREIMKHIGAPLQISRQAKEYLSEAEHWKSGNYSLSKNELEEIAKPFIAKTIAICLDSIKNSKIDPKDLIEVVLVGGSTRMPLLKQMVKEAIKSPLDSINPDLVVAVGAAIQANALIHGSDNLLLDVTSLSIGLEVMGGMNERIINKNSSIPARITKRFTTYKDGQTGMIFHIVQGEREMVEDCRSLAKFELKNIPPMKAAAAKIAVTFSVDADGLLTVSAKEETSGIEQQIEVKPSYGLNEAAIEEMLLASYANAEKDILAKALAENKLQAANNIKNITAAIKEDNELLSIDEKNDILDLIKSLKQAISGNDLALIEAANIALEDKASPFLQDRLNKQIKLALKGHFINELTKKYDNTH